MGIGALSWRMRKDLLCSQNPERLKRFRKYSGCFLQGQGTKVISNYLNDQHIPTRHGDLWSYSTITNILRTQFIGEDSPGVEQAGQEYGKRHSQKTVKRTKNYGDYPVFDGLHPALISEELFMQVQQIRLGKVPEAKVKDEFVLQNAFAGLLFCSCCGKRIGRTTLSAKANHRVRLRCVNMRNCHNGTADYDLVESQIISALRTWCDGYKVKIETIGYADDIAEYRSRLRSSDRMRTSFMHSWITPSILWSKASIRWKYSNSGGKS